MRQASLAMSIPMLLLTGSLVGYFIGAWLDARWGTDPWLMVVFIVLGFVAGVRETIRIIRLIQREEDNAD